jgi:hypothetical protein
MSVATVVVTESQYSVVITENGDSTTVVTPPVAVQLTISTPGPAGPPGAGVPIGGAAKDLLIKATGTNYDTAWTAQPEVDALQFDLTAAVDPVADGQLAWNADEGTLELGKGGVSNYIGQETMVLCRNNSNTVAIPKGTAVRFAGTLGASGRLKVAPMVADGTLPGYVFFGVTDQAIPGASDGYVTVFGKIRGINTSAYVDGDILWCDPATPGGFTKIEPQAPNLKLAVAAVINAGNNGTIFVRWSTGSRLQDLHDVEANGSKQDGDVLAWNATAGRWEPVAQVSAGLIVDQGAKVDKSVVYYDASTSSFKADATWTTDTIVDGANF